MTEQPMCERHGLGLYYDTYGYPACLNCEDENWETYYRHLVSGHSCDLMQNVDKGNVKDPPTQKGPRRSRERSTGGRRL